MIIELGKVSATTRGKQNPPNGESFVPLGTRP